MGKTFCVQDRTSFSVGLNKLFMNRIYLQCTEWGENQFSSVHMSRTKVEGYCSLEITPYCIQLHCQETTAVCCLCRYKCDQGCAIKLRLGCTVHPRCMVHLLHIQVFHPLKHFIDTKAGDHLHAAQRRLQIKFVVTAWDERGSEARPVKQWIQRKPRHRWTWGFSRISQLWQSSQHRAWEWGQKPALGHSHLCGFGQRMLKSWPGCGCSDAGSQKSVRRNTCYSALQICFDPAVPCTVAVLEMAGRKASDGL